MCQIFDVMEREKPVETLNELERKNEKIHYVKGP